MAGVVFLVLFFALGGSLIYLVHRALVQEDARWGTGHEVAPPLADSSEQARPHDRAA